MIAGSDARLCRRGRWPRHAGCLVPLVLSAGIATATAEETSPPPATVAPPPIWVPVPFRVDRDKETRERLDPAPSADVVARVLVRGARGDGPAALRIDGRRHRLFGLAEIDPGRICTTTEGHRWACGLRARAALSGRVGGRVLLCRDIETAEAADPVIDCLLQERSLSERMAADGWAELDDAGTADPVLAAARAAAERDGRGLWSRSDPP
jgi:endonuclease YncB( thermonuclease family)